MGLFNKLNRNKEEKNMDNAFVATPHFYANADKRVFGAIALIIVFSSICLGTGNCTKIPEILLLLLSSSISFNSSS